jgi:hypothetical protein
MTRRDVAVRRGSLQHETLRTLFVHESSTQEALRKSVDEGNIPSASYFRQNVIDVLEARDLIEQIGRGEYRITRAGRQMVMQLAEAPSARLSSVSAFGQRNTFDFVQPRLPEGIEFRLLISSPARGMTDADKRPPPVRRDGMDFAQWPSRRGNRLYYRDGRVTDMDGNPLQVSA